MKLEQQKKFLVAKDILFILSELSNYLPAQSEVNGELLQIIVQIMSIKNVHKVNKHNAELLLFGVNSITNLIPKVTQDQLTSKLLDKMFQLFLFVDNPKVRSQLAAGLKQSLPNQNEECMSQII